MPIAYWKKEYRNRKVPLFQLGDGTDVFYGDVLWHPDKRRVGWCCIANFYPHEGSDVVTVNSPNGAVPTVKIAELRRTPPNLAYRECPTCNGTGRIVEYQ
jgi:hypothetical protein